MSRQRGAITGLEAWEYFREISRDKGFMGDECLEVVGVRERDRSLLAEIQARNTEDHGPTWDGDRMSGTR